MKIIQDYLINDAAKTKSVCTSELEHKKIKTKTKTNITDGLSLTKAAEDVYKREQKYM